MSDLINKIEETIRQHGLISPSDTVVLAVSGGPDSLCLMHAMAELARTKFAGLRLHVGHLHHGMRREGDSDADFVAKQAFLLGFGCTIERVDVPALAAADGVGEEVAGRRARYDFLTQLAKSMSARAIATGHNADDQAETVLMRCMRGAGPRGLRGIPYYRPVPDTPGLRIIRPLLDCRRSEIEEFLRERGLEGKLDSTNLSPRYLRNRVRRQILPAMEAEMGADLRPRLLRISALARSLYGTSRGLRKEVEAGIAVNRSENAVEVEAAVLRGIGDSIRAEIIKDLIKEGAGEAPMLTARHYRAVGGILASGSGTVSLPGGVIAMVGSGRLRIENPESVVMEGHAPSWPAANNADATKQARSVTPESKGKRQDATERVPPLVGSGQAEDDGRALTVPGVTDLTDGSRIVAEIINVQGASEARTESPFEARLDFDSLPGRLSVRTPRSGDRMRPMGAPGSRKLQDILTDLRVPRWERRNVWLVTHDGEPIWIVGHRVAEEAKMTDSTRRMLRLVYEKANAEY